MYYKPMIDRLFVHSLFVLLLLFSRYNNFQLVSFVLSPSFQIRRGVRRGNARLTCSIALQVVC